MSNFPKRRGQPRKRKGLATAVLGASLSLPAAVAAQNGADAPKKDLRAACEARLKGDQPALPTTLTTPPAHDGANSHRPLVLSEADQHVLAQVEKDFVRYEKAFQGYQTRLNQILGDEYTSRREALEKRFESRIAKAETAERRHHLEAMALLEQFIQRYPNDETRTPDALFRLADLYLDESEFQFDKLSEKREAADAAGIALEEDDDDSYNGPDYTKAIATWKRIVEAYPKYRQRAGSVYLYGYYLKQTDHPREALQAFRSLVCTNKYNPLDTPLAEPDRAAVHAILAAGPNREFDDPYRDCVAGSDNATLIDEAWVRGIADIHFTTPGELGEAISAYERVAASEGSRYYDEALYKLAWSYYRNDNFVKGIDAFDKSVILSDKLVAQGKDPLELRPEALQYISVSFTDPWTSTEIVDPTTSFDRVMEFYKGRLKEPHIRDVFLKLGDTFKLLEAWPQAIDSWRIALKHTPMHPKNPTVHQQIVNGFQAMGDRDAAHAEAAKLATQYVTCGDWYLANETNREAMEDQQRIGQRMLLAAAEDTHRQAQEARRDWKGNPTEESRVYSINLYAKAAGLYKRFIRENPDSTRSYEFTYRIGETLFYSEKYLESLPYYRWVRDHRELSEERFEKSAKSIVQAYEREVERQIKSGQISEPPVPTSEQLEAMAKPLQVRAIPKILIELQAAYDEYHTLVDEPKTAPTMAYLAAIVSYRHLAFADAEQRFGVVLDRFCDSDEAVKAKDGLLKIYETRGDSAKFRATNDRFIRKSCGSEGDVALAKAQNRQRGFKDASNLLTSKNFSKASSDFYKYYKTAPADDPDLPTALYNSAIAYDRSGRPKTAIYLFKEFTENPSPKFRQSEYYVEALYLTAVAHQKAFEYQEAVTAFLRAAKVAQDKNRKQPPGGRSLERIRLDAIYNAALLREIDRVYKDPRGQPGTGAASLYALYAKLEPSRTKQSDSLWAIARVWKAAGDIRKMNAAYEGWRRKFGRDAGTADRVVFSYYDTAKAWEKKGAKRATIKARAATLKAWKTVGSPKGTEAADFAAEFEFRAAEANYRRKFEPFKITKIPKSEKAARKLLDKLDNLTVATKAKFDALGKYESAFWSQAALTRVGDVLFFSSLKLQQAPIPKNVVKLDERYPDKEILLRYEESIEQMVKPKTDAAKQQWERVTTAAKRNGVSTEWTKLSQQRLHDFVSQDDFPVLRDELSEGTNEL